MTANKVDSKMNSFKMELMTIVALATLWAACCGEAKLLRRSRYYDDLGGAGYDGPYGSGVPMPTGERAILTVRGARSPYDGSAPSKIAIEDNPYIGSYPRGVYNRLDGYGARPPIYPRHDPYNSFERTPYGGG